VSTEHPPVLAVTTGQPGVTLHETCRVNGVRLLVADPASTEQTGDGSEPADGEELSDEHETDNEHERARGMTDKRAAVAAHVAAGRVPLSRARDPAQLVAALSGVHDARSRVRGGRT
jgi:hypothetical protein